MAGEEKKQNITQNRANVSVLVLSQNGTTSNQLRAALKALGFTQISTAATHIQGLDRVKTRNFSVVFFDAEPTDMAPLDFVKQVVALDDGATLVALSSQPRVDDVFGLLRAGARSFLVLPFNVDTVEDILLSAREGPPLSDAVLNAPDRNAALVGVVLNNLYRISVLMRQAREFATAARELERQSYSFAESVELARIFCEGGDEQLSEKIAEACIARARIAASRLGRTRKKLANERAKELGLVSKET